MFVHYAIGCFVPGIISAVIDARKYIIPDSMVFVMLLYGLGYGYFTGSLAAAAAGAGIGFAITYICWCKQGVGGGDVKFATALGSWFGYDILAVLLLGSVLLIAAKVIVLIRSKNLGEWLKNYRQSVYLATLGLKSAGEAPKLPDNPDEKHPEAFPFGTFLMVAALVVYVATYL